MIEVLLSQMVGALGAQAGAVGFVDGDEVVVSDTTGYSSEGLKGWARFPVAADLPMSEAIREGDALWMTTADELVTRFPALAQAEVRFEALAILPLAVGEAPFGCVSLSFVESRDFDPEERAFLLAATQQAAYALNRAQMYESRACRRRAPALPGRGRRAPGEFPGSRNGARPARIARGPPYRRLVRGRDGRRARRPPQRRCRPRR